MTPVPWVLDPGKPSYSWISSTGLLCLQAFALAVRMLRASSAIHLQQEAKEGMWTAYADPTAGLVLNFNLICLFLFYWSLKVWQRIPRKRTDRGAASPHPISKQIDKSFLDHLSLLRTFPGVSHVLVIFLYCLTVSISRFPFWHCIWVCDLLWSKFPLMSHATSCFCVSTGY
jgi:hypothetical protein